MTLKLIRVEAPGDLENERLVLQATLDVRVGKYIVLQSKKSPDGKVFSGAIPEAYWFASIDVKKEDYVVLYSKIGQRSQKTAPDTGRISHFFYWGLERPVWGADLKPTLITASTWEWTQS